MWRQQSPPYFLARGSGCRARPPEGLASRDLCATQWECDHAMLASPVLNSCSLLQVTGAVMTGEWQDDSAREALALALGGCAQLDTVVREALREAAGGQ